MRDMARVWGLACLAALLTACSGGAGAPEAAEDPPQVTIGERLFLETRFAEFFARHSADDINRSLVQGDPALTRTVTASGDLLGAFAGQSTHCRACHLVDEQLNAPGAGMRTYADFAPRSPVSDRGDGPAFAVRNSPTLVDASRERATEFVLHFDGEFASLESLIAATLTGRNFGWLPQEQAQAVAHIARVIRQDDGRGALASEFGGAYRSVLAGTDPALPTALRLPSAFRLDVDSASDAEILAAVSRLIAAYVDNLRFKADLTGRANGSPYDLFLARNGLPAEPAFGESDLVYARRLRAAIAALDHPELIPANRFQSFEFHAQPFVFEEAELRGLQVFLREPAGVATSGTGNCIACHAPPRFTDFGLHNTGVTERGYDAVHGAGAFADLAIPSLQQRQSDAVAQAVLPATPAHPDYRGELRAIPAADAPQRVDLGAWAIYANPDFPAPQAALARLLCRIDGLLDNCAAQPPAALLDRAIASFKTPSLRDLGHSDPYMHDGAFTSIEAVLRFYADSAAAARAGTLRNPDPRLRGININAQDQADLAAFLRALNEDYD